MNSDAMKCLCSLSFGLVDILNIIDRFTIFVLQIDVFSIAQILMTPGTVVPSSARCR